MHLTYSKPGGNLGLVLKMKNIACISILLTKHIKYHLYLFNPSHAAIKISINATAAEFICKNIFPIPVQIKKIIKNKTGDIQQIYLYQNVCK